MAISNLLVEVKPEEVPLGKYQIALDGAEARRRNCAPKVHSVWNANSPELGWESWEKPRWMVEASIGKGKADRYILYRTQDNQLIIVPEVENGMKVVAYVLDNGC